MNDLKFKILNRIYQFDPTSPVLRNDLLNEFLSAGEDVLKVERYIRELIDAGYVEYDGYSQSLSVRSPSGVSVLESEHDIRRLREIEKAFRESEAIRLAEREALEHARREAAELKRLQERAEDQKREDNRSKEQNKITRSTAFLSAFFSALFALLFEVLRFFFF